MSLDTPLSKRETEYLQQMADGHSVKSVARLFSVSYHTVNNCIRQAKKCRSFKGSMMGFVVECVRKGWIA